MSSPAPLHPALLAALDTLRSSMRGDIERAIESLSHGATSTTQVRERDVWQAAVLELSRGAGVFHQAYSLTLGERVAAEANPRHSPRKAPASTDWHSLSLVADEEVESQVAADRLGQSIAHESEAELRDLDALLAGLLHLGSAERERNPLRPLVIGQALCAAIARVAPLPETRKLLAREIGRVVAPAMKRHYASIVADLRSRGVEPVALAMKQVEGPGNDLPRETLRQNSAYDTLSGHPGGTASGDGGLHDGGSGGSTRSGLGDGRMDTRHADGRAASTLRSSFGDRRPIRTGGGGTGFGGGSGFGPGGAVSGGGGGIGPIDPQMMQLIRRLAFLGSGNDRLEGGGGAVSEGGPGRRSRFHGDAGDSGRGMHDAAHAGTGGGGDYGAASRPSLLDTWRASGEQGAMPRARNVIRAHRQELREAATGALDHMVIDVVGTLFDQILSDPKVPPQMARHIARLQLPVLRAALGDATFFSSRRHPVRRFVNRIASLACAFDDFSDGPGLEFAARVRDLVQEIVDGDFDHMALYEAKLGDLEVFIQDQTQQDLQRDPAAADAVSLLDGKETQLRLQQRYMQNLQAGLASLSIPEFLRDFLAQVWSQAVMFAVRTDGATSAQAQRLRTAGRELVMSVQPKGSPAHRKTFLLKLPTLMKDLNAGLDLIGWPAEAKKQFFSQLLPAHAESLKGQPLTDLSYNMLAAELDTLLHQPVPGAQDLSAGSVVPEIEAIAVTQHFSPEEAKRIGWIEEGAVDWDFQVAADEGVDIELDLAPAAASNADGEAPAAVVARADGGVVALGDAVPFDADASTVDIDLDAMLPVDVTPPVPQGRSLIDHVQIGFAYQMHLHDSWQKVRLSYVSPGRAFFVFTRGKKHQQTISMTQRMLARMCETNRLRPFENQYLIDRATLRARKQLAALTAAGAATTSGASSGFGGATRT